MNSEHTRRALLRQGAALATGVSLSSLVLTGCGEDQAQGDDAITTQRRTRATPAAEPMVASSTSTWRPLRIGAGGWVTGIDIAPDGTKVVRTDTYGAYIWNDATAEWKPLLTTQSMPAGEWGPTNRGAQGVYEVAVAPSDSRRIYAITNGLLFKSADRGATFTRTAMPRIAADPNDAFRIFGRKMAVDPANPDVVYVGTQSAGLTVTRDGGATWTAGSPIPASTTAAGVLIAFDPSAGVTGGRTNRVYVSSHGRGVFVSDDAGASFRPTPGSPTAHAHMVCDQTGTLWLTDASVPRDNLRRFSGGQWSAVPAGRDFFHSVAVDPADARHIVAGTDGGSISQSFDGGASWTGTHPSGSGTRVAPDIPWLAWTNEGYMSNGDMRFDPSAPGKLLFAQGIGVWATNPPRSFGPTTWTSQSRGIEQLVSNLIISPAGGTPLYFAWDRPVFRIDDPEVFPSTHGPNRERSIVMGWSGDHALDDPRFAAGIFNYFGVEQSGYTTDGGTTWTRFASVPADVAQGKIGGSIAVGTHNNMVWAPSNHANPWFTRDRGATWAPARIPGVPTTGETGWGYAYFLNRHILASDGAAPDTFYIYNYLAGVAGVYRSTNGGADWTRVFAGELASFSGFNAKLAAVPGKAGHLFFTSGDLDGGEPLDSRFMRTVDGGATWTAVPNVLEVYAFGFGRAAAGRDYPAIFIAGYVGRAWGIYRSDDAAASWIKIGDYPLGSYDHIKTVSGDMNVHGRAYVGFAGSGAAYTG